MPAVRVPILIAILLLSGCTTSLSAECGDARGDLAAEQDYKFSFDLVQPGPDLEVSVDAAGDATDGSSDAPEIEPEGEVDYANLCLPCTTAADCEGSTGEDPPCVDYGQEGSFCGGPCEADEDCPWGFSCVEAQLIDGGQVTQCVADAGVCPCTEKAVSLGLSTPCEVIGESGVCAGVRICTEEGLTDCDAPIPAAETCNGVDDDCDGETDEATCDDDNECTEDVCLAEEGCNHLPVGISECIDADLCTTADRCEEGVCVGDPVECDDENPCTEDFCSAGKCEFEPVFGVCDDDDPCTAGDQCDGGGCTGTPVGCACQIDDDCDLLEDGDLCTGFLACDTTSVPYQCIVDPGTPVICPAPVGSDAPCLAAACAPETGVCSYSAANQGAPCSDGDACTMNDICTEGVCAGLVAVNCNDGNPCTDDDCQPDQGCVYVDNDDACQDGDACTALDQCQDGACQPGGYEMNCDDGNPCTSDSCHSALGCTHEAKDGPCEDANQCTINQQCEGWICGPGEAVDCDDDTPCTTDTCDPSVGCVHTFNEAPCDDADLCTVGDHCLQGECVGVPGLGCDDLNPCTDDTCDPLTGCAFTPNDIQCDDGFPCTVDDHCAGGWCLGVVADCDDENPCTEDSCDSAEGCQHLPNELLCDDGDPCTEGDICAGGTCQGAHVPCDDDDVCTDDECVPESGCTFTHNEAQCDDGDLCTSGDVCVLGDCSGTPVPCDDQEACTTDGCMPELGCTHVPFLDETVCGEGLWCQSGVCVSVPDPEVTFDTLDYNGMTGWPLDYDEGPNCGGNTSQEQMDALCQLAGYDHATAWESETKTIGSCYCWGVCTNFVWDTTCCSGQQVQTMITEVTCQP